MCKVFFFAFALILAACQTRQIEEAPIKETVTAAVKDACGANQYRPLIGKSIRQTLELKFANETRYFGQKAPVPRDPNSKRLNFVTSKDLPLPEPDNLIIDVFCG